MVNSSKTFYSAVRCLVGNSAEIICGHRRNGQKIPISTPSNCQKIGKSSFGSVREINSILQGTVSWKCLEAGPDRGGQCVALEWENGRKFTAA